MWNNQLFLHIVQKYMATADCSVHIFLLKSGAFITWFHYRGDKQFVLKKSVFGTEFDLNGRAIHKTCFFFQNLNLVKGIIHLTY